MHRPRSSIATRSVPHTRAALIRLGTLALILVVAGFAGWKLGWFDYRHTLEHVARLRRSHSVVTFTIGFVIVYALGTSVGVPGLPFTVAAGVLFGTLLGSTLSWFGAMLGALSGYWLARTIAHDVVLRWVRRFRKVDAAVAESRDFDGMLRLRLVPVIPLGTVNFVGGLARAPIWSYLAATAIGIIPSTIIYTYFADSLIDRVGSGRTQAMTSLIIASVLLILLSLTPKLWTRYAQRRQPLEPLTPPRGDAPVLKAKVG
jgi:uncharacterized membrane protein YdjX (TVP38/TMEM64 family)